MFSFPGYKEGHWGEKEGKEHETKEETVYQTKKGGSDRPR
jgi:hypothetical protein